GEVAHGDRAVGVLGDDQRGVGTEVEREIADVEQQQPASVLLGLVARDRGREVRRRGEVVGDEDGTPELAVHVRAELTAGQAARAARPAITGLLRVTRPTVAPYHPRPAAR